MSVVVDSGGQQGHGVDHSSAFADLHRQRVGGDERERARLGEGTVAEVLNDRVQIRGHAGDLGLREPVDPEGLDELVHPARADTGEVAVGDNGDQRRFRPLAPLEQPLREVGSLAELGNRDVHGADAGVQIAVAVPVALSRPARIGAAVLGTDYRVGISRQQGVDDRLQQAAHQIGTGLSQSFAEQASRVDNVRSGHRDAPFERSVEGELEGSRGGRVYVHARDELSNRATPLSGTQLSTLPYLLRVPLGDGMITKAKDTWPRTGKVYCHRVEEWPVDAEIVERVAARSCVRRVAAIDLVLDRGGNRSQIIITSARGRQMIFWQTARTSKQARPAVSPPGARASGVADLEIVVDIRERYPFTFADRQATTRRGRCSDAIRDACAAVQAPASGRVRRAWVEDELAEELAGHGVDPAGLQVLDEQREVVRAGVPLHDVEPPPSNPDVGVPGALRRRRRPGRPWSVVCAGA